MLKTRARHSLTIAVMPARRQRGALRSDRRIFKRHQPGPSRRL